MVHLLTSKEIDGNTDYYWQKQVDCTKTENAIVKYRKRTKKKKKKKRRYIVQLGPAPHLCECNNDLSKYKKHKEQRWGLTQIPKKQYDQVTA